MRGLFFGSCDSRSPKWIDGEGLGSLLYKDKARHVGNVFHIPWLSPTSSIALGQADDDQFSQLMAVAFLAMCLTAIKRKKIPAIMYSLGYDYHSSG